MTDKDLAYNYFKAAFNLALNEFSATEISINASVSESYISQVKTGKKTAGFRAQVNIANACKYNYLDFLLFGKNIVEKKTPGQMDQSPKKRKKKTTSVSISNKKGSDQMGDEWLEDLVQILKDQISELKVEKTELNQELKEQRVQINNLYQKNMDLAEALGEANRALRELRARQDNGPESATKPAANQ